MKGVTYLDLLENKEVVTIINKADAQLEAMGYTEHGLRHVTWVAKRTGQILEALGYPPRIKELGEIAGLLHDVGNLVNREHHAQIGAVIAGDLLRRNGMEVEEVADIMMAIGNHHEEDGFPSSVLSAALILADKADVHRSRVRKMGNIWENLKVDIHDRVNFAATSSKILIDPSNRLVTYEIEIDTSIAPVIEFFQIFMSRVLVAQRAAKTLNAEFHLNINHTKMI
ncbi:MAG: HD domain-containing protein [candidate division WOR-3 bacterium]